MVKRKKRKTEHWEIKEEFGSEKGFRKRDWEHRNSWGGIGFGLFLMIVAIIWMAIESGWIPRIPFWPVVLFLFSLFIVLTSLARR